MNPGSILAAHPAHCASHRFCPLDYCGNSFSNPQAQQCSKLYKRDIYRIIKKNIYTKETQFIHQQTLKKEKEKKRKTPLPTSSQDHKRTHALFVLFLFLLLFYVLF
jgi:hypothetical protein